MRFNFKKIAKIAKIAAAAAAALSLCGCGTKLPFAQKTPNFNTTYTVTADITYDKLKAKAELTRVDDTEWTFDFIEPKQLEGISISLNDEKYSASLDGLSFTAEDSAVYAAAPQVIAKTIGLLSKSTSEQMTASDGVLTFTGELDGKRVTVTADERTGGLISLKLPNLKLAVSFSDQKPYAPPNPDEEKVTLTD